MSLQSATMSASDAVEFLKAMPDLAHAGLSFVAVASGSASGYDGFRINLAPSAQESISEIAETTRAQLTDGTLLEYGPATLVPPQHWMFVSERKAATLADVEQLVSGQDLLPFSVGGSTAPNIKMLAARFTSPGAPAVTFYRIADSMLQLRRSRFLGLIQEGDVFSRLDPTGVLLMRSDFDVVAVGGYAFFTKKLTFERAFGFLELLRAESGHTFDVVSRDLRIDGLEMLRDACTRQTQMMAKMSSIKRNMDTDPAYCRAMTMSNLVAYIAAHPHVDIDIVGAGDEQRMVFDPKPARRFQILKLLDDDFLHSILTEREYEAGSKIKSA